MASSANGSNATRPLHNGAEMLAGLSIRDRLGEANVGNVPLSSVQSDGTDTDDILWRRNSLDGLDPAERESLVSSSSDPRDTMYIMQLNERFIFNGPCVVYNRFIELNTESGLPMDLMSNKCREIIAGVKKWFRENICKKKEASQKVDAQETELPERTKHAVETQATEQDECIICLNPVSYPNGHPPRGPSVKLSVCRKIMHRKCYIQARTSLRKNAENQTPIPYKCLHLQCPSRGDEYKGNACNALT